MERKEQQNHKEDNKQLHGIIKTVMLAGIMEIICIMLSTGSSLIIQKHYRNAMDEAYQITMELEELSQYLYRYQNVMSDYIHQVNINEDYEQELGYAQGKIEEKLENVGTMLMDIHTDEMIDTYNQLKSELQDYLGNGLEETAMQERAGTFKRCTTQQGILAMELSEYSNNCRKSSSMAEKIIALLNIIIIITVIISVYNSHKYVSLYGKQLQELKEKADEANHAKSAFLANMSHEIRTPINAVLTMDEMILRENDDETINDYAMDIKSAGNTLLSLINDILDMSKIESGKMELIKENYQICDIVKDIYILMSDKAKNKGLKLEIITAPEIPSCLYGDSLRIKQIMVNLMNNAIKYTKEGTVTLQISMKLTQKPDRMILVIRVKDTGAGIRKEDMERLFAKFERIEENKNRNIEGTGLGMSITKQLTDMMHGHITVKSKYGKGSEFKVTIPQKIISSVPVGKIDMEKKQERKEYCPGFTAPNAHILVVDDNAMNRKGIALLLKKTLVQIEMAETGEECIARCREGQYDIILLDHRMPGMDGIETLAHLQKIISGIPVIMLTANAQSGAKEEYLKAGFTDFLSKPVEPEALERMIYKYLPKDKKKMARHGKSVREKRMKQSGHENIFSMEAALEKCSTQEIFEEMAAEFVESYESSRKKIEDAYRQQANEYRISVHALKSNARMIGLNLLGTMAEEEERRAVNGLWDEIQISHENLMEQYESSYQYMKTNYYKRDVLQVLEKNDDYVREQCSMLPAAIKNGDLDLIDVIADSLRSYEYPYKKELEEAMILLDYEKIELLVEKITLKNRK